ncbi:MAG: hypothetical protein JO360_06520 [Acidobacteria bacterium]|nr:hypothetical protein [Acidobacteriota bacterium]
MSCCGSQRTAFRSESSTPSQAPGEPTYWTSLPVEFEYTGASQLTVTGPLTGILYVFAGPGARLQVHGSDVPSLLSVPGLKPLS